MGDFVIADLNSSWPDGGLLDNSTAGNATSDDIIQERNYNILLWTPFIAIPFFIISARVIKYVYRIYQAKKYGFGDDLIDDPLAQLGLAQLGLVINRGYDDLSDIRKIRKEQKKLERKIARRDQRAAMLSREASNVSEKSAAMAAAGSAKKDGGDGDDAAATGEQQQGISAFVSRPLFLAENYLAAIKKKTRRTWLDVLSPEAVRRWFATSQFARVWMIFQVLSTAVAIVNYVMLTYSIQRDDRSHIKVIDLLLATIFLSDYAISMYIAEDRLAFYFNFSSLVDLVSIVPPFVYVFVSETSQYVWFLGLLRILRASRILRTYRLLSFSETEEKRELTIVALTFCNFIFLSASVINALETINADKKSDPTLTTWHDSLYYIMVTFSTIGFGDLTPSSIPSRIVVMILIIVVIVWVPLQSSRISEIYNASSTFQRAKYSASTTHPHVILSGSLTYSIIIDFCREFLAADEANTHIIILAPPEPNIETRQLLRHPFYRSKLRYLAGTPLSITDLRRASAHHATAMFLINAGSASTGADDVDGAEDDELRSTRGADAEILMQSLVAKTTFPGLPILAQVRDVRSEELSPRCGCDRVLCLDGIKMAILARDCIVPGFLALVLNLVSTYRDLDDGTVEDSGWLREYKRGALNQIFSFRCPPGLVRMRWVEAVESVFRAFHVTLFAVCSTTGHKAGVLRLNPGLTYELREDDVVFCVATGGDEIVLRVCIQFKDPVPKEHLAMLELEAQLADGLEPLARHDAAASTNALKITVDADERADEAEGGDAVEDGQASGHVILCGHMTARGVKHFLKSVRSNEGSLHATITPAPGTAHATLATSKTPILCLLDKVPEAKGDGGIWDDIRSDPDVTLMKGTPLKKTSLEQAGIKKCKRIVIFSTPINADSGGSGDSSHTLPDANSIFIIKMIQEEWPKTHFLVELVSGSNIRYFSTRRSDIFNDTNNLRMQSILNNYALGIGDRLNLYKRIRQKGAEEERFINKLVQFIIGKPAASGQPGIEIVPPGANVQPPTKKRGPRRSKGDHTRGNYAKLKTSFVGNQGGVRDGSLDDPSARLTENAAYPPTSSHLGDDLQTFHADDGAEEEEEIGGDAIDEEELNRDTDHPSGKSSAPLSTAYLEKLVNEAELNDSGISPFPVHHFDPWFAMGAVAPLSFTQSLLAQSYFRPFVLDVVKRLAESVILVKAPRRFVGRRYSEMLAFLVAQGFVPLGLYRAGGVASAGGSELPYVYTNCHGFDIIGDGDRVFVIGSTQ
ncbi:hypothetical protein HK101_008783 [Irineochytrium annulatum]|nr:hypothetical protein HK101_008783 [Irineochytrium annulatum]